MLRYIAIFVLSLLVVLLFFAATGCTFHFKAQELEFEADQTRNFDLDGIDVFGCPILRVSNPVQPRYDAVLEKTYAFK